MKGTVKKLLPMIVLAVSASLMSSCGNKQGGLPQSNEYPVITIQSTNSEMSSSYPATIRGKQDIEIRPKISGFITKLCVDEGSVVRKGQVLFTIDNVQYRAVLNQAEASLNSAKSALATAELTYNNKKELYNQNIVGDFDLQSAANSYATAKATVAQAEAAVVSARDNLSYCNVTSPSDGVVGTIPYRVGSLVSSSMATPLTVVSNIDEMYVYFSVNEKQILEMTRASEGKNVIEAFPEVQLELADGSIYTQVGHVSTVSGVIDQNTGSVSVRADFANPDHLLKSGGQGNIIITRKTEGVIIIPQAATAEVQDKVFVYVLGKDNKVSYTAIEVDPQNDGQNYIVTKGLKDGDRIVTKGITKLTDGAEIKPVTEEQYAKSLEEAQKLGRIQGNYKEMKKAFGK
ncbi:MAG: efflux RND transporter periplasmic adaptor subunit [Bacteroidaceae bacterium]|nr:efflux RND transporter periplasmic adaptor subunit [Bacteroidaceae bacterium]